MKLKSAELVNALRAAFKQLNVMTQSSVNIGQTVFKAEQGNFLLFANYFDKLNVSDQAGIEDALHYHLARAFNIDNPEVADLYVAAFQKPFTSAGAVTDKDVIRFIKGAVEEVLFSEDLFREFSKTLADIASAQDHAALTSEKVTSDTVNLATDVDTLDVGKALSEVPALTDDSIWAYGKITEETPTLSDEVDTKDVTKLLTDTVDATDDIDGNASILDDQEMQFRKITTHSASLTDTFYRQVSFIRDLTDAPVATDVDTFAFGKSLDDSGSVTDSNIVLTGKQINDIPVATDTLARSFGRPLSDSSALTDNDVWSFGKSVTDTASSTDAGSLRSQGYSDFAYFGEDFVGASKTF